MTENLLNFILNNITSKTCKTCMELVRDKLSSTASPDPMRHLLWWSVIEWAGKCTVLLTLLTVELRGALSGLETHTEKVWAPVCAAYLSGKLQSSFAAGATGHWAGPHASTSGTLCGLPSRTRTARSCLSAIRHQRDGRKMVGREILRAENWKPQIRINQGIYFFFDSTFYFIDI